MGATLTGGAKLTLIAVGRRDMLEGISMDKVGASPPPKVDGRLGAGTATGAGSGSLGDEGSSVVGSNTG
jgi:hypothetical protein